MEQVYHARLVRFITIALVLMQWCCHLGNKHEIMAAKDKHCRLVLLKSIFWLL